MSTRRKMLSLTARPPRSLPTATLPTPTMVSTRSAMRSTRPRPTRFPLSLLPSLSSAALPAPKEVCVTKDITITEVKCEDKVENKCFNVAKFVDATNTVDQKEIIIGEPSCEQITLTLDTQACRQQHHKVVAHAVPVVHHATHHAVHHAAPVHHAPVYHGK